MCRSEGAVVGWMEVLVSILSAKGRERIEFIGSMIDLESGMARDPVTKSVCISTMYQGRDELVGRF